MGRAYHHLATPESNHHLLLDVHTRTISDLQLWGVLNTGLTRLSLEAPDRYRAHETMITGLSRETRVAMAVFEVAAEDDDDSSDDDNNEPTVRYG
jgi:hypothetical protein